jgi:hypothetical protein
MARRPLSSRLIELVPRNKNYPLDSKKNQYSPLFPTFSHYRFQTRLSQERFDLNSFFFDNDLERIGANAKSRKTWQNKSHALSKCYRAYLGITLGIRKIETAGFLMQKEGTDKTPPQ